MASALGTVRATVLCALALCMMGCSAEGGADQRANGPRGGKADDGSDAGALTDGGDSEALDENAVLGDAAVVAYAVGDLCDSHAESTGCMETSDQVLAAGDAEYVFVLGDNAYERGTIEEYESNYEPAWGRLKDKTFPAPGNHEGFNYFKGYFDYFGRDGDRKHAPGLVGEGFYSFDLDENWHVAVMNTDKWDTKQSRWLKRDLAKAQSNGKCLLVTGHHPRFSPGSYGPYGAYGTPAQSPKFWKVLTDTKVDLYLSGHDHIYGRFAKLDYDGNPAVDGTRQVVIGTGGRELYLINNPAMENLEASYTADVPGEDGRFGVLRVLLGTNGYALHFTTGNGKYVDDVAERCNARLND